MDYPRVPPLGKKFVPDKHWEQNYDATDPSSNMIITQGSDFNPKCPSDRKTTHVKVNREDH